MDVPDYVAKRYAEYGITGFDLFKEYLTEGSAKIKVVKELGFGKGDLVIFARETYKPRKNPLIAVPTCYKNILKQGQTANYLKKKYGLYHIFEVNGSTEGFVADGIADLGFDFTTQYQKAEYAKTTLMANHLKIIEKIMSTEAVLITRDSDEFTFEKYEQLIQGPCKIDWKKMGGLVPVIVQEVFTKEILMLAYANQNALHKVFETGLATFYSRDRQTLWIKGQTSGNIMQVTEVLYDCDRDALIYKVKPTGPACHLSKRSCFNHINKVERFRPLKK